MFNMNFLKIYPVVQLPICTVGSGPEFEEITCQGYTTINENIIHTPQHIKDMKGSELLTKWKAHA